MNFNVTIFSQLTHICYAASPSAFPAPAENAPPPPARRDPRRTRPRRPRHSRPRHHRRPPPHRPGWNPAQWVYAKILQNEGTFGKLCVSFSVIIVYPRSASLLLLLRLVQRQFVLVKILLFLCQLFFFLLTVHWDLFLNQILSLFQNSAFSLSLIIRNLKQKRHF